MPTDTFVQNFVISKISRSKFEELSSSGMLNENEFYLIEDPQIDAGNQPIVNVSAPSSGTDAANKGYVDEEINGLSSSFADEISGLSSSISGKADTSALNELASSVSSSFTTVENELDGFSSSFAELSSTVDGIQPAVEKSILSQGYLFDSKQQFPAFSLSSTYQEDDLVSYNGKRWEAQDTYSPGDIPGEENLGWSEYDIDKQLSQINTIKNKINKAGSFTTGNIPTFSALGNLNDSGKSPSDFALASSVSSSIADINTNLSSKLDQSAAADEWSSASSYSSGSIVVYQGQRYKCIADVAENTGWTGDTNWTPETIQQALEGIDVSSQIKGKLDADSVSVAWDATRAYQIGEVVEHDGSLWKCMTAISEPSSSSSNEWDETLWAATVEDITTKLRQKAAAPEFNPGSTYFVNEYVTYNGNIYKCVNAKTTASNITPENDIYNASSASANHWKEVDMTSPDATLDITSGGALRVVGADGTILWMEGYDLESASSLSGASMELSNTALNAYNFVVNSTDKISLVLPTAPSGKVGDFIIDIYNPSIGDAFSESSTYSSGAQAFYNGDLYSCTTAVETAGAWTGSTNWTLVASAFNSSSDYSSGTNVVYEDAIWKCQTSSVAAGSWTGTDDWQTASFIIPQWENNTIGIVVPVGDDLRDMLTFAPGTMCEMYFTQTAFNVGDKPTWKVVRQDVEDGGAS